MREGAECGGCGVPSTGPGGGAGGRGMSCTDADRVLALVLVGWLACHGWS